MNTRIDLGNLPVLPSVAVVNPPVSSRLQRLPLAELSWENFERLCVRLAKKDPDTDHAQSYGVPGQNQDGIDLYIRRRSNGRYTVWQCKRYQVYTKGDVLKAVRRFIKAFKTGEAGIPIQETDRLVLAVTADLTKTEIANEIERLAKRLRRRFNISFGTQDVQGLSDTLKSHSDIVADFFHPIWAEEFCGLKPTGSVLPDYERAMFQTTLRAAQEGLSSSGNEQLDRIRDLWGEWREAEALSELEKFEKAPTWPLLNADVQAKALRMEAGLRLQMGNVADARRLLEQAKKTGVPERARVLEGLLIQRDQGAEAALAFFGQPITDDERVFRWNLLLELGRPKEVTDEFAVLNQHDVPAGDFSSVLAFAQLAQRDISAAERTILAALEKKPRHANSRQVSALVDYYSGISTVFRAWQHMTWPVPPPWSLVKRDDASRDRRKRAAGIFDELATTVLKSRADELRVWQLACVALNANEASAPSEIARSCLLANPTNLPVLVWASAFNLAIDRTQSVAALNHRLEANNASIEELLALLGLIDDTSGEAEYERLVTSHRALFVKAGREHLWYMHQAVLLVKQNKLEAALELMDSMPAGDSSLPIKTVVRSLIAERSGREEDYRLLLAAQKDEYQSKKTGENLLACCRTCRSLHQWEFIAEHAGELVREVGTQSVLELGAEGLLYQRRPKDCLALLEGNRILCQGGEWTPFLRQLAAEAHRVLGDFISAISELEKAAAAEPGVAAKMQLFQTQKNKGDLLAASQLARSFGGNPDVPAEFLISEVIPVVRHHDLELAKELILKAESAPTGLSPQAEVKLMEEAYRAGVESVARRLTAKLTQQAVKGEGPLKGYTFEEFRQLLGAQQKAAGELSLAYARGEIPVHFLCGGLSCPIAKVFHEAPKQNIGKRSLLRSRFIFTRHAGDSNSQPRRIFPATKELFLDISSLLLLDVFGMLPNVEKAFDKLHIGASLIQCLEGHLDPLSPRQPSRSVAHETVVKLLDGSKINVWRSPSQPMVALSPLGSFVGDMGKEWCERLFQVHAESGLFVDFLPLHSVADINRSVTLPAPFSTAVISVQKLIRAMQLAGWITAVEPVTPVSVPAPNAPAVEPEILLREGMTIHLGTGQAEELALATVLEFLCDRVVLTMDADVAGRLREDVLRERSDADLKQEIQRLIAHLSSAISKGKYQVHVRRTVEPEEQKISLQPEQRLLCEALDFSTQGNVPVCVDDRLIGSHSGIGQAPLCDTWDILHYLKDKQSISEDLFRQLRSRMRAANLRYLPVSSEEILTHVLSAPIQDGVLRETPELATLRCYVAATLLDNKTLQNPVADPQGKIFLREGAWPARLQIATIEALSHLWRDADPTNDHVRLQASWIWQNLCFGEQLRAELFDHKLPDFKLSEGLARQIASLYGFGAGLYDSPEEIKAGETRRIRYFQWLRGYVLTPLLPNNPELWRHAAAEMRTIFSFLNRDLRNIMAKKGAPGINEIVLGNLIGSYIADLPPELSNELGLQPEELKAIGVLPIGPNIEILGFVFSEDEFWKAIARALQKNHAAVWTMDKKSKLGIRYDTKENQILVHLKEVERVNWRQMNVPFLGLLAEGRKRREAALRRESHRFDEDEPRLTEIINEICSIESAPERVARRTSYNEESATALYADLGQKLNERKGVYVDALLPRRADCLRRFLRLELIDQNVEAFAGRLLKAVGWEESVFRLSGIPAPLPAPILQAWAACNAVEQAAHLDKLASRLITPAERLHLLELLCHPSTVAAGKMNEIKAQINWLTGKNEGLAHGNAMLATVLWAHLRLGWHDEMSRWPSFARMCVAWSHGTMVHRAFQAAGGSAEYVTTWFGNNSQELFADRFIKANGVCHDAANPNGLRIGTLLLKGVAFACRGLTDQQLQESGVLEKLPLVVDRESVLDNLDIWTDRSLGGNLLGSYLADLPGEDWKRVIGEAASKERFQIDGKAIAKDALDVLLEKPDDPGSIFSLSCVVGDRPMYEELRPKLAAFLAKTNILEFFDVSRDDCYRLILLVNQMAASLGEQSQIDEIWARYRELAARLAASPPTDANDRELHEQFAFSLADAAMRFSASQEGRTTGVRALISKLTELAKAWPAFSRFCGPAVVQALNRMPAEDLSGMSQLICLVRNRP
jgi:hypothetical protein